MDKSILRQVALRHKKEIMQPYDTILESDGFDAICAFSEHLGGFTVYVPSLKTIFARCLEREVQNEFTGCNYATLARKYGYTERHLRRILGNP